MNKEKILKIVKILSIAVWVILLVVPMFISAVDEVTYVSDTYAYNETTKNYEFTINCDKDIVDGEVAIAFYNDDGIKQKEIKVEFADNKGKSVTIEIAADDIPTSVDDQYYEIADMYVTSKLVDDVNRIVYGIAIGWLVWLIYVLNVNILVAYKFDKKIEVFAGWFRHSLKIDGETTGAKTKLIMVEPLVLTGYIGEGLKIYAKITFNKRIEVYAEDAPIDGAQMIDSAINTIAQDEGVAETPKEEPKIMIIQDTPVVVDEKDDGILPERETIENDPEDVDEDGEDE